MTLAVMPEQLTSWMPELPDWASSGAHPVVAAAIVVVLSLVAARIAQTVILGILRRIVARTSWMFDDEVIESLSGPIVQSVVLVGLWYACDILEGEADSLLWVHRLIVTVTVIVWLIGTIRVLNAVLSVMSRNAERYDAIEERTLPLFSNLGKLGLFGVAIYAIILIWGLDATGWLASAGVAGVVLGFAAKDSLANLFAGVFIIADAPYRIGDYVNLDNGHRGRIIHIGLRSTRIVTRDDVQITVPNSVIGNSAIVNETSGEPRFRVRVKVGVAYGSDVDQVRTVLEQEALAVDKVMRVPEPRVRFRSFGDSALQFELLVWIPEPELRGRVLDALHMGVYKRFLAEGIEIAFPQQDLHLRGLPDGWPATSSATD